MSAANLAHAPQDVAGNLFNKSYEIVQERLKELSALNGISGLLQWDEMVMMPPGAAASRGAQKSALTGVLYDKRTDKELGALLKQLQESSPQLDQVQAAVVRDAYKSYIKETAIPKKLAQRIAQLESDAYMAWVKARKESDFSAFAPYLQQWVDVSLEKAKYIDPKQSAYDVLLDDYEKGMTTARLDEVFVQVREGLKPLIAAVKSRGTAPEDAWLHGDYDVDTQAALCKSIALDIGFNLDNGRLDVSVHPFTGGAHPTDVRMTTRFKPHDVTEGLTGAIHETGHALYEQGRNLGPQYEGLPVNAAMSMGIHESQSLLWERMVALSEPFSTYLYPKIKQHFPQFPDKDARALYEAQNVMKDPSFIRVESDELTYPMHIILRYEIEKGLLDGSIKVADVPAVWNAKMEEYLGCKPADDAAGCLQDVHWSAGLFGYFPTYSLGAMYACQIFQTASKAIPGLDQEIAKGNFKPLKEWLNTNIHQIGSLYNSGDELMTVVTGAPLDPSIFLGYLKDKYSKLYKL